MGSRKANNNGEAIFLPPSIVKNVMGIIKNPTNTVKKSKNPAFSGADLFELLCFLLSNITNKKIMLNKL
ncbi:hypothetical protein GCM10008119_37870 [Pedobacter mendelii]|uniref:Uncharacterized protein n=2 Tax=Pedobacter mendelii TaxID=1908240 RepID=A0ABQ2BMI3_9SPHI|nr:hypothetical protein GCM10008119_37870 [Pedobacter mendelii]